MAVHAELDVLEPRQHALAVVDPNQRLDAADPGIGEVGCDVPGGIWREPAVGVDDHDDHPRAVFRTEPFGQLRVGVVEAGGLADPRVPGVPAG